MNGRTRMADAYEASDPVRKTRRRKVAGAFKENAQMEELLRLKEEDPAAFEQVMSPSLRTSLGYYIEQKEAARAEGLI